MTEAMAFLVLGIWGLVALGAAIMAHATERKEWQAERKDLLNRLMARDYQQYAEAERQTITRDNMTVVNVEELVNRIQQQEREELPVGMPV